MIMVSDPQLLKHIYTHRVYDFVKHPGDVLILEAVLGRGLLLAEVLYIIISMKHMMFTC